MRWNYGTMMMNDNKIRNTYSRELIKLGNEGKYYACMRLLDEMKLKCIELNNYTVSALLTACIKGKMPNKYESIWNDIINGYNVKPNHLSYLLAIKAASQCRHGTKVKELVFHIKNECGNDLKQKHWNEIIHAFSLFKDINEVLNVYNSMRNNNFRGDKYTVSIILNTFIKCNEFSKFEYFLMELMNDNYCIEYCIDHHSIAVIFDGIVKSGNSKLITQIWNKISAYQRRFNLDINSYGVGIVACYQSNNIELLNTFVNQIKSCNLTNNMTHLCWHQILTGYGSLQQYSKMWDEYYYFKQYLSPNITTFNIICNFEPNMDIKNKAITESRKYISNWNDHSYIDLKGFYRICSETNNTYLANTIWNIMESKKEITQVNANYNGMNTNNLYKTEQTNILKLTKELIKKVGHTIDTSIHPEISHLKAYKLLSFHAEKKALSYLIHKNINDIQINVDMRMCSDCHKFFRLVSQYYPDKIITCIDPKIRHQFKNGYCSCNK